MLTLPLIPANKKIKYLSVGALFFFIFYLSAASWGLPRAYLIGFNWMDQQIPFLPWTIWFYISQYLILPFSFIWVQEEENFSHMYYSMLAAIFFSCSIFFFYPTRILRPETLDSSIVDTVRWLLYKVDAPTNCFPSLHVAFACLSSIYVMREHKFIGVISWIWSILIIISTMTLKQHYVIDVIGGIIVAFVSYLLTLALIKGNLVKWPTGNLIAPQKHTKNTKLT
jgi:membrane-associated phospholipid phosphatase